MEINILEVASELAHERLLKYVELHPSEFPFGIFVYDGNGDTYYTEEAQDLFNELYDIEYDNNL